MIGYVYIMVNTALPKLIKIGRTTKTSEERASELETTGIPGKFIVIFDVFVDNCIEIENLLHLYFENKRYSKNREFFEIKSKDAISKLIEISDGRILLNEFVDKIENLYGNYFDRELFYYLFYISTIGEIDTRSGRKDIIRIGVKNVIDKNEIKNSDELREDLLKYYKSLDGIKIGDYDEIVNLKKIVISCHNLTFKLNLNAKKYLENIIKIELKKINEFDESIFHIMKQNDISINKFIYDEQTFITSNGSSIMGKLSFYLQQIIEKKYIELEKLHINKVNFETLLKAKSQKGNF